MGDDASEVEYNASEVEYNTSEVEYNASEVEYNTSEMKCYPFLMDEEFIKCAESKLGSSADYLRADNVSITCNITQDNLTAPLAFNRTNSCAHEDSSGGVMQRSLWKPLNLYLVSTLLADTLFLLIVQPMYINNLLTERWQPGELVCKIYISINLMFLFIMIYLTTALSVERYHLIVNCLQSHTADEDITKRRVIAVNLCVWILAILFSSPYFITYRASKDYNCVFEAEWLYWYILVGARILLLFVLPFSMILVFYIITFFKMTKRIVNSESKSNNDKMKSREKTAKMFLGYVILACFQRNYDEFGGDTTMVVLALIVEIDETGLEAKFTNCTSSRGINVEGIAALSPTGVPARHEVCIVSLTTSSREILFDLLIIEATIIWVNVLNYSCRHALRVVLVGVKYGDPLVSIMGSAQMPCLLDPTDSILALAQLFR
uniref:G-protein coupled receptors family 1 profile domain-containing protein n=1 Tax=Timema monikensis TaxID=170555 RepID=A0A7R9HUM2_9NEOP|nr:unnamed protein product [Timema monikensis]